MNGNTWVVRIAGKFFTMRGMVADINQAERFDYETALFLARPYANAEVSEYRGF